MSSSPIFRVDGTWTALVTPFRDGRFDEDSFRALVEEQISEGITGLVPCGTTGESVSLSAQEHRQVIAAAVEQSRGRVPVLAGAGTVSTQHTIALSRAAKDAGADALLLVTPYYNRPLSAGMALHYREVVKQVPMPTVLYNVPARTGTDLKLELLGQLKDLPEIVAVKEATGNIVRSQQIVAEFGDRYQVLCGDDALTVGVMAVGGVGVVSVTSNVAPALVAQVVQAAAAQDYAKARQLQQRLLPLHEALFVEPNPGPVKFALSLLGKISEEIRVPLSWPSEPSQDLVRIALQRVGISPSGASQ